MADILVSTFPGRLGSWRHAVHTISDDVLAGLRLLDKSDKMAYLRSKTGDRFIVGRVLIWEEL